MKLIALALIVAASLTAQQPDAQLHADVLTLVQLEGSKQRIESNLKQLVDRGMAEMVKDAPTCKPAFAAEWGKRMLAGINADDFVGVEIAAYERHFSDAAVKELIALLKKQAESPGTAVPSPELQRKMESVMPSVLFAALALSVSAGSSAGAQETALNALRSGFAHPPANARIMMRWWWFGPAVTKPELARELETMKAGGIGGVEIQPVYALELDDPTTGFRNLPYLSRDFLGAVGYAAETARKLGLRVDLTLNSGWPYGGSTVPVTEAASSLRVVIDTLPRNAASVALPSIRNGEKLLAVFLAPGTREKYDARQTQQILPGPGGEIANGRLKLSAVSSGPHAVLFFLSSRTGQLVKRAGVGAEGFVLDHFSQAAVQDHLRTVGEPLLAAFGSHPPISVFSDSLEVYGADWTPDLLGQFRKRRGYDLTPYLPALTADIGPKTLDIRYDWARTLAELIDDNYLAPITAWAHAHRTQFRSQTYGTPAVTLSSNRFVDLPEGEGSQWRGFSYTRWATSASHVYGRPITSTETWTWLHSPAFRATPLDMKAEADTFFLQGSNQLVGHGWPYSPESAGDPGWSFYAAAVFNQHNPWWMVMPEITGYLQRLSYLLRQGKPANTVAVLLPTEDAQAQFRLGEVSITDEAAKLLGHELIPTLLDSGYSFDFIDSEAILRQGIHYPVLVLPGIQRLPLSAYRRIAEYARQGGIVLATERAPSVAPGLKESTADSAEVEKISSNLFSSGSGKSRLVGQTSDLGAALKRLRQPDVELTPQTPDVGFIERKLSAADIYFLANTGNQPHSFDATFRTGMKQAEWWDPFTGKTSYAGPGPTIHFELEPYGSRVLVFSNQIAGGESAGRESQEANSSNPGLQPIDISNNWKVAFEKIGVTETMRSLHSWADDSATRYYSGAASYEREIEIPANFERANKVLLDFGAGVPVERVVLHQAGTRAWLEGPVREAAVVYVNGKRAGSVWHPPYTLDLGPLLRPGRNDLKIVVANTAINELAGRATPDYRLLNSRYGTRFLPQDMDHLEPLPSGILHALRLEPEGSKSAAPSINQ